MWKTVEDNQGRPGYLGKHREDKYAQWNKQFGSGKVEVSLEMGKQIPQFCTGVWGL